MKKINVIFGVAVISLLLGCKTEKQHQALAEALNTEIPKSVDHLSYDSAENLIRITCSIAPSELKEILEINGFQRAPKLDRTIDFGITDKNAFRGVKLLPLGEAQAYSKNKTTLWVNSDQNRIYLIYEK